MFGSYEEMERGSLPKDGLATSIALVCRLENMLDIFAMSESELEGKFIALVICRLPGFLSNDSHLPLRKRIV